ncbi:MAG TPA: putative lipid II flippase FtsW [Actinomycetota bacterium]
MASRTLPAPRHLRVVSEAERPSAISRWTMSPRRTIAVLVGSTTILTIVGVVMVLSASYVFSYVEYGSSFLFFKRQAVYAVVGFGALLLTSRMRYTVWQRLAAPFLGITILLLVLVLHPSAGTVAGGSARWIALGPVTIQPSEFAKLALIAFGATVLARRWKNLDDLRSLLLPLLPATLVVCGLVMLQPDLGTTVILAGSMFMLVFATGISIKRFVAGAAAGGALGTILILSETYRRERLLSFLHPWQDPANKGYQLIQSLIALGSGGWFGVGLGASRQKWLYVPNAHTDFIFAVLGEELGLIGELVVIALFCALLYSGIRIAVRAPDTFGRLLAGGIVSWLGLQVVVNLGAVTGLLPVTGVPLPLMSFGGSSLVVSLAAIGILVNIGRAESAAAAKESPTSNGKRSQGSAPSTRAAATTRSGSR